MLIEASCEGRSGLCHSEASRKCGRGRGDGLTRVFYLGVLPGFRDDAHYGGSVTVHSSPARVGVCRTRGWP